MKRMSLERKYILWGIIFVSILGSLAHGFYDWLGKNWLIGLIFPNSESTWEHMKLAFIPMLIYSCVMRTKMTEKYRAFPVIALCGNLLATWFLPVLCYSYRGILGFGVAWADIATFFVAVILAFVLENHMIKYIGNKECSVGTTVLIILNGVQLLLFVGFSYHPLPYGIFQVLPQ